MRGRFSSGSVDGEGDAALAVAGAVRFLPRFFYQHVSRDDKRNTYYSIIEGFLAAKRRHVQRQVREAFAHCYHGDGGSTRCL